MRKDPTPQMRGWAGFSATVDGLRRDHGAAWIATSSYATTGQLAFALKDQAIVEQLNERLRYVHLPTPDDDLTKRPALYVELERRVDEALLLQRFENVRTLPALIRADGSAEGARYGVYLLASPLGPPLR